MKLWLLLKVQIYAQHTFPAYVLYIRSHCNWYKIRNVSQILKKKPTQINQSILPDNILFYVEQCHKTLLSWNNYKVSICSQNKIQFFKKKSRTIFHTRLFFNWQLKLNLNNINVLQILKNHTINKTSASRTNSPSLQAVHLKHPWLRDFIGHV